MNEKNIVPLVMFLLILIISNVFAEIKPSENPELSKIVSNAVCTGNIDNVIEKYI